MFKNRSKSRSKESHLLFNIGQLSIDLIHQSLVVLVQVLLTDGLLRLYLHLNNLDIPLNLLDSLRRFTAILEIYRDSVLQGYSVKVLQCHFMGAVLYLLCFEVFPHGSKLPQLSGELVDLHQHLVPRLVLLPSQAHPHCLLDHDQGLQIECFID